MLVISTWGSKEVSRSDMLQLRCMFDGLVHKYYECLLVLGDNLSDEELAEVEEEAHECRTIALRISGLLGIEISEAQTLLSLAGNPYVG